MQLIPCSDSVSIVLIWQQQVALMAMSGRLHPQGHVRYLVSCVCSQQLQTATTVQHIAAAPKDIYPPYGQRCPATRPTAAVSLHARLPQRQTQTHIRIEVKQPLLPCVHPHRTHFQDKATWVGTVDQVPNWQAYGRLPAPGGHHHHSEILSIYLATQG